jgi:hypothetical protein
MEMLEYNGASSESAGPQLPRQGVIRSLSHVWNLNNNCELCRLMVQEECYLHILSFEAFGRSR